MTDPRLRIHPPEWLNDVNARVLADPQWRAAVLNVVGRKTGGLRRTPVTLYEHDGARYVVGGFPGADWVRNVRAADHAVLAVDGHDERVPLVELDAVPGLSGPERARKPDGVAVPSAAICRRLRMDCGTRLHRQCALDRLLAGSGARRTR